MLPREIKGKKLKLGLKGFLRLHPFRRLITEKILFFLSFLLIKTTILNATIKGEWLAVHAKHCPAHTSEFHSGKKGVSELILIE
jgi:hypothetical protein